LQKLNAEQRKILTITTSQRNDRLLDRFQTNKGQTVMKTSEQIKKRLHAGVRFLRQYRIADHLHDGELEIASR
jgi:hypothetical protein